MIVLTSWDDGHPSDHRIAEMLQRHDLKGTFFIPIRNRERRNVCSAAQLRELDNMGFEIGSHTLDHAYLPTLSKVECRNQIQQGKIELEQMLGRGVSGFCYPGGQWNTAIQAEVKAAGFVYARTTENFRLDLGDNNLLLPTTLQLYPHTRSVYLRNVIRHGHWRWRYQVASHMLRTTSLDIALDHLFDQPLPADAIFHLWGHSWELDCFDLWPLLDRVLAKLKRFASQSLTLEQAVKQVGKSC